MARVGWLPESLLGVIEASFGLGACFFNASGTCDQNGSCVTGTAGDPAAPDAGGDSSTGEVIPECASDAECDDGNLCTTDACASGSCVATALADGEVAGQVSCQEITCYGGVETREPLAATTLCDGNKVCDGEGNCTGCDAGHPCPDGYECTGEGLCVLPVGSICAGDAECGSGHCVDSVCCAVGCDGVCMSCSSFTGYSTCTYTQAYDNHAPPASTSPTPSTPARAHRDPRASSRGAGSIARGRRAALRAAREVAVQRHRGLQEVPVGELPVHGPVPGLVLGVVARQVADRAGELLKN